MVDFGSSMRSGTALDLTTDCLGTASYLPPEALETGRPPENIGGQGKGVIVLEDKPLPRKYVMGEEGTWQIDESLRGQEGDGKDGSSSSLEQGSHLLVTSALDMWSAGCILYM